MNNFLQSITQNGRAEVLQSNPRERTLFLDSTLAYALIYQFIIFITFLQPPADDQVLLQKLREEARYTELVMWKI